jgi:hypothetical protein
MDQSPSVYQMVIRRYVKARLTAYRLPLYLPINKLLLQIMSDFQINTIQTYNGYRTNVKAEILY